MTEEKVVVRFENKKGQDAIYEITLCQYLDPDNELPINPNKRFLCSTSSARGIMKSYRMENV